MTEGWTRTIKKQLIIGQDKQEALRGQEVKQTTAVETRMAKTGERHDHLQVDAN